MRDEPFRAIVGIPVLAEVIMHADGFAFYMAALYRDWRYEQWRATWDTTEQEDFISGVAS